MFTDKSTYRLKPHSQTVYAQAMEVAIKKTLELAEQKGWNQRQLAAKLDVEPGHVTNWKSRGLPADRYKQVADLFKVSIDELLTGSSLKSIVGDPSNVTDGPNIRKTRSYPLISDVQAGDWTDICDNFQPGDADDWRECHKDLGKCGYLLRVSGDSMTGAPGAEYSFPSGFLLYVNPDLDALPGKFVIVRREGEVQATFKRYVTLDGEQYLEALNPIWPNRYLKLRDGDVFCGVVVHAGRDLP